MTLTVFAGEPLSKLYFLKYKTYPAQCFLPSELGWWVQWCPSSSCGDKEIVIFSTSWHWWVLFMTGQGPLARAPLVTLWRTQFVVDAARYDRLHQLCWNFELPKQLTHSILPTWPYARGWRWKLATAQIEFTATVFLKHNWGICRRLVRNDSALWSLCLLTYGVQEKCSA
jgi:hypothetical protein